MSRKLNDLDPRFRPLAVEFLARLVEARIQVMIIDTLRTPEEHRANLEKRVSWVTKSKHLEGLAIDVAPYQQYLLHGSNKLQWDGSDAIWTPIGEIGEACGMKWGGRWKVGDFSHFEYVEPNLELMA